MFVEKNHIQAKIEADEIEKEIIIEENKNEYFNSTSK